jgi:hypothetical protein
LVDGYRRNQGHPWEELIHAISGMYQEELPATREALERIAERGEGDE